jgi:hypothetical protein
MPETHPCRSISVSLRYPALDICCLTFCVNSGALSLRHTTTSLAHKNYAQIQNTDRKGIFPNVTITNFEEQAMDLLLLV